jgi:hypothetical protein
VNILFGQFPLAHASLAESRGFGGRGGINAAKAVGLKSGVLELPLLENVRKFGTCPKLWDSSLKYNWRI